MMIEYNKTEWMSKQDDGTIPEGAPAMNADNLNNIENGITRCVEQINENSETLNYIISLLQPTVIWENNNPNSVFTAQTIERDLSQYNRFSVLIKSNSSNAAKDYCEYSITSKNIRIFLKAGGYDSNSYDYGRFIIISNSGIEFLSGQYGGNRGTSYDSHAIPVKIIGFTF
jgi:hypothetical protein